MVKKFIVIGLAAMLLAVAAPAMAATQTLTILGGNGVQGDLDPYTEFSTDGGTTWHQAYMSGGDGSPGNPAGCWHPWGVISGTSCWINQDPLNTVGINITTLYRVRFNVPADAVNPTASIQLKADNHADVSLNGTFLGSFEGGPLAGNPLPTAVFASAVQPGLNEITINLNDWGGIVGFNYRIDLTMDSSKPLSVAPASSSPAGIAAASGNISRTGWEMNRGGSWSFLGFSLPSHGYSTAYNNAVIPPVGDAGWGPAPNSETIGFSEYSILPGYCMQAVDYTYFQTFVTVPFNTDVTQFTIAFSGIDDGGRVTIFNSAYPNGILVPGSYVYLGGSGTANLANYIVPGENRVVVTQVDDCPTGNNLQVAQVVLNGQTISHNQPPVADAGAAQTVECSGSSSANVTLNGAGSSDPDSDPLTYSWSWSGGSATGVNPSASFPLGTTAVSLTVNDGQGHTATAGTTVTVQDTTAPTVSAGPDVTLEATGAAGAAFDVSGQSSASDSCCAVSITAPAAGTYGLGTHSLTVSSSDCSGNTSGDSMLLTVVDTTAPVLTVPAAVTAEANAVNSTVAIGSATATDIFAVAITSDAPATFPLGTTVVTWTATDANGNATSGTQNVTVVDTTAPVLTVPADVIAEANAVNSTVAIGNATATDIFAVTVTSDAPATYPLGTTVVTWTAVDANGNSSTGTQNVTVVDTTAPVLTVPADVIAEANAVNSTVAIGNATATDIFAVTVTSDAPATYPLGTTVVTWTAVDANGNSSTGTQNVTVVDTTAPVLTVPADVTVEANGVMSTVNIGNASATDIFSVIVTSDAPAAFALGTTVVTWTATDANGNATSGTQNVTVVDTTAPTVTAQLVPISSGHDDDDATFQVVFSASDIADPNPVLTATLNGVTVTNGQIVKLENSRKDKSEFEHGTLEISGASFTLTATATDASGNVGTASDAYAFPAKHEKSKKGDDDRKSESKSKDRGDDKSSKSSGKDDDRKSDSKKSKKHD